MRMADVLITFFNDSSFTSQVKPSNVTMLNNVRQFFKLC